MAGQPSRTGYGFLYSVSILVNGVDEGTNGGLWETD